MRPLTSLLLPCWNALRLTKVCLAEVLRATTQPFELVVVLDGCTDGTARWLGPWARTARSPYLVRTRTLVHRRNRGYSRAMNRALAAARGERLVFANNDAAPAPGWLEEMSALFEKRPRLGGLSPSANGLLSVPPADDWAAQGWYSSLAGMRSFAGACALRSGIRPFVRSSGFIPGFWFMTTRAAIAKTGGFDEALGIGGREDWDLQERLRAAGYELGFAPRAYVHHAWAAAFRANGLSWREVYFGKTAGLRRKHPGASRRRFDLLTPFDPRARSARAR